MKHKLLFFLSSGVGGAERITVTIGKLFDRSKFIVEYVVIRDAKDQISKFIPEGYKVHYLDITSPYFSTFKFYFLLKQQKPDGVFCASPAFNSRLLIAAKLIGNIKAVVRNSNIFATERIDVRLLMKFTYPWAKAIILQQDEMKQELDYEIPSCKNKTYALQNPLDIENIIKGASMQNPFPKDDSINYLWVGRIAPQKAQDVLVDAFSIVGRRLSTAHLYLVGGYEEKSAFFQTVYSKVEKSGCSDRIHFIGYDPNPYRWLNNCTCFVLPSRYEGLPNALIEAMYLGKPTVSTRCLPIIDRMIIDGYNGYRAEVEDVEGLADAMLKSYTLKSFDMIYHPATIVEFEKHFE